MLNLVCYVSLCEGLRAEAGSLSYIVHVDCCGGATENAGQENTGLENDGQSCRGGKCRTGN